MTETRTVTTLRRKRDEISASMRLYEKKPHCAAARPDIRTFRVFWGSPDDATELSARGLNGVQLVGNAPVNVPAEMVAVRATGIPAIVRHAEPIGIAVHTMTAITPGQSVGGQQRHEHGGR
jgi:hypothetical protein